MYLDCGFLFELIFISIIIILVIILALIVKAFLSLKNDYESLRFSKQSQSVKYGQLTEQWIPFSKNFPYNTQSFRFIGKPVDGVAFEDDKIVFVEFKSNKSSLNESQKRVKELVKEKKVEWFELRAD
jgi:predicted Holliday junction resolvase-like endonuclease